MEQEKREDGRFTLDDIKNAYNKLKSTIFYDSGDLLLREQLVEFETNYSKKNNDFVRLFFNNEYSEFRVDNDEFETLNTRRISLEEKLIIITDRLNNYDLEPEFFDNFIDKIKIHIYPKKLKKGNFNNTIISNIRVKEEYSLEKVTAFIKAPIELHLLSVLWTINDGIYKDAELADECIGNRLLLKKDKSKIVQGSGLFKPYFSQYQTWRDCAVKQQKNY